MAAHPVQCGGLTEQREPAAGLSAADECPRHTLREIARAYGTPTYAFDLRRLRGQVQKLRACLPDSIEILYSLKANASLGIAQVFARCGIGADVASAGEFATALAAGYPPDRIFVAGPFKTSETIALLAATPDTVCSVDSPGELRVLAERQVCNPLVLRLRPDFGSGAIVAAGSDTRFGITSDGLRQCRDVMQSHRVRVVGFHVFLGSQVLDAADVVRHLRGGFELAMRAAEALEFTPSLLNLGGGFGIPYGPRHQELDLERVGAALNELAERAAPARIVIELGRYLVAQAGWYLTTVLGPQTHRGRVAVVVDGGTHQRADLCGLRLRTDAYPPTVLGERLSEPIPTDVLGCLSLPADCLVEASALPELEPGNVLAFPNAGAYGLWSSPALFHGSPLPAEVAFDGESIRVMRQRQAARSVLDGQHSIMDGA